MMTLIDRSALRSRLLRASVDEVRASLLPADRRTDDGKGYEMGGRGERDRGSSECPCRLRQFCMKGYVIARCCVIGLLSETRHNSQSRKNPALYLYVEIRRRKATNKTATSNVERSSRRCSGTDPRQET